MISKDMVKRQKSLFDEMSDEEYLKAELKKLRQQELINREKQAHLEYAEEYEKYYQIPADLALPYLMNGNADEFYEKFFREADERKRKDKLMKNTLTNNNIDQGLQEIDNFLENNKIKVKKIDKSEENIMKENKIITTNNENLKVEIQLGVEQRKFAEIIEYSNDNVYCTGKAGSGKTEVLKWILEHTLKDIVALAPTGVAALNIGGQTIHSFFHLKPTLQTVNDFEEIAIPSKLRGALNKLDAIIIDEISMVSVDIIEMIDKILKKARNSILPFGGVQMIFFGDLYQLPPITKKDTYNYLKDLYGGVFFFNSPALKESGLKIYELNHIFRQDDLDFKNLLNQVRSGNNSKEVIDAINKQVAKNIPNGEFITIASTKSIVDAINTSKLKSIDSPEYVYKAVINGDFKESNYPTDSELHLKVGAQVMMTANDKKRRWVNGSLGTVVELNDNYIKVKINNIEYTIQDFLWEDYRYKYNPETKEIYKEVASNFNQYPIKLAWATTIHKSQGKTFNSVLIDLGDGTFDTGQLYVALSRCTTLDKLYLKTPVKPSDIKVNMEVVNFMKNAEVIKLSEAEENLS